MIGVQISPPEGAILGERRAHCKCRDFLPWALQERLNRSICRLDCGIVDSGGPKEAQVQSYSPGGPMCPHGKARWRHLANTIEPSVCGGDVVSCEITLTTCCILMRLLSGLWSFNCCLISWFIDPLQHRWYDHFNAVQVLVIFPGPYLNYVIQYFQTRKC